MRADLTLEMPPGRIAASTSVERRVAHRGPAREARAQPQEGDVAVAVVRRLREDGEDQLVERPPVRRRRRPAVDEPQPVAQRAHAAGADGRRPVAARDGAATRGTIRRAMTPPRRSQRHEARARRPARRLAQRAAAATRPVAVAARRARRRRAVDAVPRARRRRSRPTCPGFGASAKRGDLDYSIDGYADWLERFCALAGLDRRPARRCTTGASVGLAWAQRGPSGSSGSSRSTPCRSCRATAGTRSRACGASPVLGEAAMGMAVGPGRAPAAAGRAAPEPVLAALRPGHPAGDPAAVPLEPARACSPRRAAGSATIAAPALVLHGARDRYIPARFADGLAAALGDGRVEHVAGRRPLAVARPARSSSSRIDRFPDVSERSAAHSRRPRDESRQRIDVARGCARVPRFATDCAQAARRLGRTDPPRRRPLRAVDRPCHEPLRAHRRCAVLAAAARRRPGRRRRARAWTAAERVDPAARQRARAPRTACRRCGAARRAQPRRRRALARHARARLLRPRLQRRHAVRRRASAASPAPRLVGETLASLPQRARRRGGRRRHVDELAAAPRDPPRPAASAASASRAAGAAGRRRHGGRDRRLRRLTRVQSAPTGASRLVGRGATRPVPSARPHAGRRRPRRRLPDRRPGDGRHGGAHVPHVAVEPGGLRDVERAVVRRPSHGRLLAALPAARRAARDAARRRRRRRRRRRAVRGARAPAWRRRPAPARSRRGCSSAA